MERNQVIAVIAFLGLALVSLTAAFEHMESTKAFVGSLVLSVFWVCIATAIAYLSVRRFPKKGR